MLARLFGVWLVGAAALLPRPALALKVVVFPIESKVEPGGYGSKSYTPQVLKALTGIPSLKVIEATTVSRSTGFDAAAQAAQCGSDVFCLVQIGEALDADRLIVGYVRRDASRSDELRLSVVDVGKAAMIDTLRFEVPPKPGAMEDAAAVAARHLLIKPDGKVTLAFNPADAILTVYGERVGVPPYPLELPYWAGVYHGQLTREGYEPKDVRVEIKRSGVTRLELELEQDPLYVKKTPGGHDKDPPRMRRTGPTPPVVVEPSRPSAFANVLAWGVVAVGGVGVAVGGVMMKGAQDDYNVLSGQLRYSRDQTVPSIDAAKLRDDSRSSFSTGSKVTVAGAVIAVAGLGWMIVSAAIGSSPADNSVTVTTKPIAGLLLGEIKGITCELPF